MRSKDQPGYRKFKVLYALIIIFSASLLSSCDTTEVKEGAVLIRPPSADAQAESAPQEEPVRAPSVVPQWNFSIINSLLEQQNRIGLSARRKGDTPLIWLVKNDENKLIRKLLKPELAIDIDQLNQNGESPLIIAVSKANVPIAGLLLKNGANVNMKSPAGDTPIMMAIRSQSTEMINQLIDWNAMLGSMSEIDQETPLTLAVLTGNSEIVQRVLSGGAPASQSNGRGQSPLSLAVTGGHSKMVDLLVHHDDSWINKANNQGDTPLLEAIRARHPAIALQLIDLGADLGARGRDGRTPLHMVAEIGDQALFNGIIGAKPNVNLRDNSGDTALTIAARNDRLFIVEGLYFAGASLEVRNKDGQDGLMRAVQTGNINLVGWFLDQEAPVNGRSVKGESALSLAVVNGYSDIANALKNAGASIVDELRAAFEANNPAMISLLNLYGVNPDIKTESGDPLLVKATEQRQAEMVAQLLGVGANPNVRGSTNSTPLMIAVANDNPEIARNLVSHGANVYDDLSELIKAGNILLADKLFKANLAEDSVNKNNNLEKLLHLSAASTNIEVDDFIAQILNKAVDVDWSDPDGATVLMKAAATGKGQVVDLLIDRGANPKFRDNQGKSALIHASQGGFVDVVNQLVTQFDLDVNAADQSGSSALTWAIISKHEEIASLLLSEGADPDTVSSNGVPLLIEAVSNSFDSLVEQMLQAGAEINATNPNGDTALMWAASIGNTALVTKLLESGADKTKKNNNNDTAFTLAQSKQHDEIMGLLVDDESESIAIPATNQEATN